MDGLTRDEIKKIATNETTYLRGVRYYSSQAVTNVKWNRGSQQYFATVKGSNDYNVSVALQDNAVVSHQCNCAAHAKHEGACKHVVALLLFISDYFEQKNAKNRIILKMCLHIVSCNILKSKIISQPMEKFMT